MIFVTVGSMFPFDRLIRVMDDWAATAAPGRILAQIGHGSYVPRHMEHVRRLSQADFTATMAASDLIVAHAGMGTVITAGRVGRPLVLLPRIEKWGEHTTDHQIATANWLRGKPGIFIADTDADLPGAIAAAQRAGGQDATLPPHADPAFTDRLRAAILGFLDQTAGPRT
ncbi:MAG: hypothetical protein N2422_02270 [Rhodobacteraceae bacterium]|nr:hypothetical protein [Paracoccaceae bacterium]